MTTQVHGNLLVDNSIPGGKIGGGGSIELTDYTALRAYSGPVKHVNISSILLSGAFIRDDSDTTSADNGGTIIVAANGKRWKRVFSGAFDIRWFGAVGDNATDCTNAIQNAINVASLQNGIVFLPPGTFKFSQRLTIASRITIQGSGMGNTAGGADSAASILVKTTNVVGILIKSGANFCTLNDFALIGTATTGTSSGIQNGESDNTNGAGKTTFRNIVSFGHKGHGLDIQNGNSGRLDKVYLNGNGLNGLNISSTQTSVDNANAWVGTGITAQSNLGNGVHIGVSSSNSIIGIDSEGNSGYGLYINRPYNFINGYVENNTIGPLCVDTSAFNNVVYIRNVSGTYVINNSTNHIYAMDGSGTYPFLSPFGWMNFNSALIQKRQNLTWSGFVSIPASTGNIFNISVTGTTAWTIGNPSTGNSSAAGQRITITISNASGGTIGATTWSSKYKMATWTNPANGYSRSIDFYFDGNNWIEISRTTADVPN